MSPSFKDKTISLVKVKKQQNLLGEIRGLIISSQGILGDNQSPHGNNQFPKGDQGNKTISLGRHKKTSSRTWIGTKKKN